MPYSNSKSQRLFLLLGNIIGWFALVIQFYLIIENRVASIPETIVRYFSFFTISTNILVTLCFSALLWGKSRFFHKGTTQTALAVYILVVGLVYNTVLRSLAKPQGLDSLVNELLHSVMPLFYFLYWLIWTDKKPVQWKHVLPWLAYPLLYLIYTLIRGSVVHFYPYPFVNADKLGYPAVLVNSLWVSFAFLAFSLLLIAVARGMSSGRKI